jgi:ribosomal protein L7Ae-like RNA K-turn-binding protein
MIHGIILELPADLQNPTSRHSDRLPLLCNFKLVLYLEVRSKAWLPACCGVPSCDHIKQAWLSVCCGGPSCDHIKQAWLSA